MKATLKKTTPAADYSFSIRKDRGIEMLSAWHYHPEIEFLHIKRSLGTCLIGDHVGTFKGGDTYLFGSNLPHTFRHEKKFMERTDDKRAETLVVLFKLDTWGSPFLNLPELRPILHLLNTAKQGLKLKGETRRKVCKIMEDMMTESSTKRLIQLLNALEIVATTCEYETISGYGFLENVNQIDKSRMDKIFEYTFNNFHQKILVENVAAKIAMSKHSFCRYFKLKTKKTYVDFLIQVRIGHACRLLIEQDFNVTEVSYACGYNNLSHFYHQFKKITQKHPLEYRAHYERKTHALMAI